MLDVTICVSTFGIYGWKRLAEQRALPNAHSFGVPVIYNDCDSLAEARNEGLYQVTTEYVLFLDADDELEPGFFDEMELVTGDLRPPSVRYYPGHPPKMPKVVGHEHECVGDCLRYGNWLVIGTVARTELLKKVGGWKEYQVYEDFDLWQRCWIAGATITPVPKAIYRAYLNNNVTNRSRNSSLPAEKMFEIQDLITRTNLQN